MGSIKHEAIGGFNAFLKAQQELPGKTKISLVQFDNLIETPYDMIDIGSVQPLNDKTFQPRGMTALYDAIGSSINRYKASHTPTEKTIVAILTDGEENSSQEYNYESVRHLIEEAQGNGWEVLFLGANMNAVQVATDMGIKACNATTYDYTSKGMSDAMNTLSVASSMYRGAKMTSADGCCMDSADMDLNKLYLNSKNNVSMKVDTDDKK